MEENKKCCEKRECVKCNTSYCSTSSCCMWLKCPMIKYLIWAIIIVVVFCIGVQWGEMREPVKGPRYEGKMINWNLDRYKSKFDKDKIQVNDEVIVEINKETQE